MSSMNAESDRRSSGHGPSVNGWLVLMLLALIMVLLYRDWQKQSAVERIVVARGNLAEDEKATIELFNRVSPSVVHVTNLAQEVDLRNQNVTEFRKGIGSGFVWNEQGHIVTNFHVIQGAVVARVTLSDNTELEAKIIGVDETKDIAVLKVDVQDAPSGALVPIPLGTSNDLQVGQKVFAIGSPFELDQTLTTGVIGGLGREIKSLSGRPIQGVIQTDAAINPGNSGGPLLDSAGRLIGMNTAIAGQTGNSVGIGFAVPVDTVQRIVPQLIRDGRVTRPGLGINTLDDTVARRLRVNGVIVAQVMPDSAAEKAGLRSLEGNQLRDVIVAIDGQPIGNHTDLYRALDHHKTGDIIRISVRREDGVTEIELKLQPLPAAPM